MFKKELLNTHWTALSVNLNLLKKKAAFLDLILLVLKY